MFIKRGLGKITTVIKSSEEIPRLDNQVDVQSELESTSNPLDQDIWADQDKQSSKKLNTDN